METFTEVKPFADNPDFQTQRLKKLKNLEFSIIDKPIVDIIRYILGFDYCFTLQSCYGHFVHIHQKDRHNVAPLSTFNIPEEIEYRLAYVAICLDNNDKGKELFNSHKRLRGTEYYKNLSELNYKNIFYQTKNNIIQP